MKWTKRKGNWNPKQRAQVVQRRLQQKIEERQRLICEFKENMKELESRYQRKTTIFQASVLFTLFAVMLQWTVQDKPFTLLNIAGYVGQIVLSRPCARVVLNYYRSWRLSRSFKPLFRLRHQKIYLQDYPMVRRKAIAWTRRRLFKRKEFERDLTAEEFAQKMNALFSKYDVFASPGQHLKWSVSTALRFMHRIKLEYGAYSKGYCDGHDREDVLAYLQLYIAKWYSLEPRMHLWIKQTEFDANGDETFSWRHVDEFKLKGHGSLNRDNLPGCFGGQCKIGTE